MKTRKIPGVPVTCLCRATYLVVGNFEKKPSKYAKLRVYYAVCPTCGAKRNPWPKDEERCNMCHVPRRFFTPQNFFRKSGRCRLCAGYGRRWGKREQNFKGVVTL